MFKHLSKIQRLTLALLIFGGGLIYASSAAARVCFLPDSTDCGEGDVDVPEVQITCATYGGYETEAACLEARTNKTAQACTLNSGCYYPKCAYDSERTCKNENPDKNCLNTEVDGVKCWYAQAKTCSDLGYKTSCGSDETATKVDVEASDAPCYKCTKKQTCKQMKPGVYYGPGDTCPQYRPDRKEVDNVKGSDGQCSTCDYQTCSYYGYKTSCAANQSATEKLTKDQASDGPCYTCVDDSNPSGKDYDYIIYVDDQGEGGGGAAGYDTVDWVRNVYCTNNVEVDVISSGNLHYQRCGVFHQDCRDNYGSLSVQNGSTWHEEWFEEQWDNESTFEQAEWKEQMTLIESDIYTLETNQQCQETKITHDGDIYKVVCRVPTCSELGYQTTKCSSGYKQTDYIQLPHEDCYKCEEEEQPGCYDTVVTIECLNFGSGCNYECADEKCTKTRNKNVEFADGKVYSEKDIIYQGTEGEKHGNYICRMTAEGKYADYVQRFYYKNNNPNSDSEDHSCEIGQACAIYTDVDYSRQFKIDYYDTVKGVNKTRTLNQYSNSNDFTFAFDLAEDSSLGLEPLYQKIYGTSCKRNEYYKRGVPEIEVCEDNNDYYVDLCCNLGFQERALIANVYPNSGKTEEMGTLDLSNTVSVTKGADTFDGLWHYGLMAPSETCLNNGNTYSGYCYDTGNSPNYYDLCTYSSSKLTDVYYWNSTNEDDRTGVSGCFDIRDGYQYPVIAQRTVYSKEVCGNNIKRWFDNNKPLNIRGKSACHIVFDNKPIYDYDSLKPNATNGTYAGLNSCWYQDNQDKNKKKYEPNDPSVMALVQWGYTNTDYNGIVDTCGSYDETPMGQGTISLSLHSSEVKEIN